MKISTLLHRGIHHKNFNEDFLYTCSLSKDIIVCAVMDGCSSAKDSQFTSALYAKSLNKSSRMLPQMKEIMEVFDLNTMALDSIAEFFLKQLFEDLKRAKKLFFLEREELLSTIVLLVIDKKKRNACIKMSGDGIFAVNDEITEIDQNNIPNFLGYHLDSSFEDVKDTEIQSWSFKEVRDISISTDGIDKLRKGTKNKNAYVDPREVFLIGKPDSFEDCFLQNEYQDLVNKGFIPHDDIGMIRLIISP